jgi:hypothetical protein
MILFAVLTLGTLALWALAAAGVGLAIYNLVTWLIGTADKAVDERQEVYSRLGGVLDTWQLPKFAGICHSLAALAIVKTIRQVRSLVDAIMPGGVPDEVALLRLFEPNFYFQLGKRVNVMEDRSKLVRAVLDHAETKAAIVDALATPKPTA